MRVRRIGAAVAVAVVGVGVAALVGPAPAGADVALIDVQCDLPAAGGLGGGFVPDTQTLDDLEVDVVDSPDPVVQGQPMTYVIDLPVPNITDGLELPAEFAPYGTLEVNNVLLTVPIPAGFTTTAAQVRFAPSQPWLTVTKAGSNLVFRVESTVAGSSPTGRSPIRIDLDATTPVIEIQQTPGVWVSVTPLPQVTIAGTASGAASTTIDLKPPSLVLQAQYNKQVAGGIVLDIAWNDTNVPCVPLAPTQTITSTAIVAAAPALTVTKALGAGDDAVAVGETIHYTVTVTNSGNVPLTGVTLSDPNASCEAVATTLAIDAHDDVACTHVAALGDVGAYANIATADSTQSVAATSNTVSTTVTAPVSSCLPPQFPDVLANHQFFNEICWMVDEGITEGYGDGTFKPGNPVTRQAMAAFLLRLSGDPDPTGCVQQFSDVSSSHPFFEDICWMVGEEITTGYPDDTFKPGARVSRGAMAAFLYRLEDEPTFVPPATPTFPDVGTAHPFFLEVQWMVSEGITGGFPDGSFRPSASVTRQSMAAFLYRLTHPT